MFLLVVCGSACWRVHCISTTISPTTSQAIQLEAWRLKMATHDGARHGRVLQRALFHVCWWNKVGSFKSPNRLGGMLCDWYRTWYHKPTGILLFCAGGNFSCCVIKPTANTISPSHRGFSSNRGFTGVRHDGCDGAHSTIARP